jgi:hypothetical protein
LVNGKEFANNINVCMEPASSAVAFIRMATIVCLHLSQSPQSVAKSSISSECKVQMEEGKE